MFFRVRMTTSIFSRFEILPWRSHEHFFFFERAFSRRYHDAPYSRSAEYEGPYVKLTRTNTCFLSF
ncbi:hypothetical protein NY2A_b153R [Paramecium bursaria Chlorella virus NY2A]|uniref:Uncharacterized protein b153R n=1 Tax=Paramecium bursaria Chlorella virus NY2A TaxID=46021 RepID=A7IW28_PBCVN|nr:hypothetical protein NY2A_b153R [Paramecium bursaria Chlorella virus NY2A]ABT14552.1 hypothetical protein NY2A_b153R [Paramecium bursaria Chlorella virus NY2A]